MAIPFDYLNRFTGETGTLTAAKLSTGEVRTESWLTFVHPGGYANNTGVFADLDVSGADLPDISVGAVPQTIDGSGGIRLTLTEANNPDTDVWRIQFPQSPLPSYQQLHALMHVKKWDITDESAAAGDYNNDLMIASGPGFTAAQIRDIAANGTAKRAICHGGGGNGGFVHFSQSQGFFLLMKHDGTNLNGEMVMLDAADQSLIGASASIPAGSAGDIGNFDISTYLRSPGLARSGDIEIKFVALGLDISAWPPADFDFEVPAPTDLSRTQSGIGTISVDWDRGVCGLWRVERRINGGSWSTVAARYRANEAFVDDTLSNGDEVEYRITTLIGIRESDSEITSPITVNNSAFGGPAFTAIATPSSIVETTNAVGFRATALQDFDITHLGCHITGDQFSPTLPVSVYESDQTTLKGSVDVPTTGGAELVRHVECDEKIRILNGETFYVVVGPLGYNKMGLWSTVTPSGAIGSVYDVSGTAGSFFTDTVLNRISGPVSFLWETPVPEGETYDEVIGLDVEHSHTLLGQATFQGAVGLAAGAALPDSSNASLQAASTLAAIAAHSTSRNATLGASATFAASAGLTPSVIASLVAQFALAGSTALSPAATLVARAVAAMSAAAALNASDGGTQTYQASIDVAAQAALVTQALNQVLASASLPAVTSLSPAATLTASTAVTFAISAAIAQASAQLHATAVSLQAATGVQAATATQFQASLALAIAAVLEAAGTIAGTPTYDVLHVAAESLRSGGVINESLS